MVKYLSLLVSLLACLTGLGQIDPHSDPAFLARFFPSGGQGQAIADGWAGRVVANGGAMPSAGTISAVATFYDSINSAGLVSKMYNVNIIAPDSLMAIRTPLIYTLGTDPYGVGASFPDANRSVNGYTGTGVSSFYLNLGFSPNNVPGKSTNIGYSIYYYNAVNEARNDLGVFDGSNNEYGLNYVNGDHRAQSGPFPSGRFDVSNPGFAGNGALISYNITPTDLRGRIWGGNSAGWAQYGGDDTVLGADTSVADTYYFFTQKGPSGPQNGCTKTLSFLAVHQGLTGVEASNFWYAIQTLRTNLGGGYR